jgi:hypothetical protein
MLLEIDNHDILHFEEILDALKHVKDDDYPFKYTEMEFLECFLYRAQGKECPDCGR